MATSFGFSHSGLGSKTGNQPIQTQQLTVGQSSQNQTIIKKGEITSVSGTATLKHLVVNGTSTFNGPATFTGSPTDIQTENLLVKDPTIALGAIIGDGTAIPDTDNTGHDRGLLFHYKHANSNKMGFFGLRTNQTKYYLYEHVTINASSGVINGNPAPTLGNLTLGEIDATEITATGITVNGDVTVDGHVTVSDSTNNFIIASHDGTNGLTLGTTLVTSSGDDLNLVAGSIVGTVVNSKAVIYGPNGEVRANKLEIETNGRTIEWDSSNHNLTSNQHWNIVETKKFKINNQDVLSGDTLGGGVLYSSLTTVGTLTGLTVDGHVTVSDGTNDFIIASHDGINGLKLGTTLVTASAAELNHVKDVTSPIQTQIDDIEAPWAKNISDNTKIYYNTGNVGIGTTSPDQNLHVYGDNATILIEESPNQANQARLTFKTTQDDVEQKWTVGCHGGASPTGPFKISESDDFDVNARLTIKSGGNVGIGTTSPSEKLHVQGNIRADHAVIGVGNASATYSEAAFRHESMNASTEYAILQDSEGGVNINRKNDRSIVFRENDGTNQMIIASGGRVGMGTSAPRYALVVFYISSDYNTGMGQFYLIHKAMGHYSGYTLNDGIRDQIGILCEGGNICSTYTGTGGHCIAHWGVLNSSDERIKFDIEDIDDSSALEKLREIQPKTYKYKDKPDKGKVYGFIAQQVKTVFPEAVDLMGKEFIPDIMEHGVYSSVNKTITFTNFDTSELPSSAGVIRVVPVKPDCKKTEEINYISIIDSHTIEIDTDISEHCGTYVEESAEFIEGNNIYVQAYQVEDFHLLRKESIFTLATAALQEVDRQLQAEKAKVATLETTSSTLASELNAEKTKVATLETTSSTLTSELNAEKTKVATLETTSSTLASELNAEKTKVATLETTSSTLTSELNAEKTKVATLETTVADLVARITALEG